MESSSASAGSKAGPLGTSTTGLAAGTKVSEVHGESVVSESYASGATKIRPEVVEAVSRAFQGSSQT